MSDDLKEIYRKLEEQEISLYRIQNGDSLREDCMSRGKADCLESNTKYLAYGEQMCRPYITYKGRTVPISMFTVNSSDIILPHMGDYLFIPKDRFSRALDDMSIGL